MRWIDLLRRRLRALTRSSAVDAELRDEMQTHLEQLIQQHIDLGLTPADARTAALREFGGIPQLIDESHDARGVEWMRSAVGMFVSKSTWRPYWPPSFLLLIAGILGIAVASTVVLAKIFDAAVLHPVPGPEPQQVLALGGLAYGDELPNPVRWWRQADGLEALALYHVGDATIGSVGSQRWIRVAEVSSELLKVFRVSPALGRDLIETDETQGHAALISHDLWRTSFAHSSNVLGTKILLNDQPFAVVGVMPDGFEFPSAAQVWVPRAVVQSQRLALTGGVAGQPPIVNGGPAWVGRLKPGVTIDVTADQLTALLKRTNEVLSPKAGVRFGNFIGKRPLIDSLSLNAGPTIIAALIGSAIVLLIASVNASIFLLGRATARQSEIALSQVLGATPRRVLRQILGEAVVFGLVSGLIGLSGGWLLFRSANLLLEPFRLHLPHTFGQDLLISAAAVALGLGVGLGAGLIPAFQAMKTDPAVLINQQHGRATRRGSAMARRLLLVSELALALVLLVGAFATLKAMIRLSNKELGYDPTNVSRVVLRLNESQATQLAGSDPDIVNIARADPDVAVAGIASGVPIATQDRRFVEVEGGGTRHLAATTTFSGNYLGALGIERGGAPPFLDDDGAVISERLASSLFGLANPVGQAIRINGSPRRLPVIGVVQAILSVDQTETVAEIYQPYRNEPLLGPPYVVQLVMRCTANCAEATRRVSQHLLREGFSVLRVEGLTDAISTARGVSNVRATVSGIYAMTGLAIAVAGIISLVADIARRRRFEIGIRKAIGASVGSILILTTKETWVSCCGGVLIGSFVSVFALKSLQSRFFGIEKLDVPTLTLAAATLLIVSAIATVVPAFRAAVRRPMDLLRP